MLQNIHASKLETELNNMFNKGYHLLKMYKMDRPGSTLNDVFAVVFILEDTKK